MWVRSREAKQKKGGRINKKLEKLGLMSIEEAIEEINRRSIKLSAVSKGAFISSQNFAVASYPGYTVTYTAAPSTHSTQPPVAGSWVKSINLSTLCPEVENIKLGTFLVCLGVYFRLVDNSICSHQHKRSLYTITTKHHSEMSEQRSSNNSRRIYC